MTPMRIYVMENNVDESAMNLRREQAIAAYSETVKQLVKTQGTFFTKSIYALVPRQDQAAQKLFDMVEGTGKGKIAFFETVRCDATGYGVMARVHFPIDTGLFKTAFTAALDPGKMGVVEVDFFFGIFNNLRNLSSKNLRIEKEIKQFNPAEIFDASIVLPTILTDEKLELLTVIADKDSDFGKKQWFRADDGSIFGVEIASYAAELPAYPAKKAGVTLTKKTQ